MTEHIGEKMAHHGREAGETNPGTRSAAEQFQWDVFVCHASEDKEPFVKELARELDKRGIRVWYDQFTLSVGDSLRRSIDKGLINSRYGIVVLSPRFFIKEWPQIELDGLAVRERNGEKVILPIWLNVGGLMLRHTLLCASPAYETL